MASNLSTTSYLINRQVVVNLLSNAFSEPFSSIESIVSVPASGAFLINGTSLAPSGFVVRNPSFYVTKSDVASFLSSNSGVVVSAGSIANVRFFSDTSYVEVEVVSK